MRQMKEIPRGRKSGSVVIIGGRGSQNMGRLPTEATHRGKIVNVRQMLRESLLRGQEHFKHPANDLKWTIRADLTMHIYPPEVICL